MRKSTIQIMLVSLAVGITASAAAQDPDVRNIRPNVVLILDTSGSMERDSDCVCTTPSCAECVPDCSMGAVRNRWAFVLEALTGTFQGYDCTTMDRTSGTFSGMNDYGYYLPHVDLTYTGQDNTGVLDVYVDRARFGLMTFDSIATVASEGPLMTTAAYDMEDTTGAPGMYSYADDRDFQFLGCDGVTHRMNNGVRNENADAGQLISVGAHDDDHEVINQQIQDALLVEDMSGLDLLRPYGATPIAGALEDLSYYFDNHPDVIPYDGMDGDPYESCRATYAILLTDGYPNADMRGDPYDCDAPGVDDPPGCPYEQPEDTAANLCQLSGGDCTGDLDGLFVVGFDVEDDPAVIARLDDIAAAGGTGSALVADDLAGLLDALSAAIDQAAPGTTSRTTPAFANLSTGLDDGQAQHQLSGGFVVGDDEDQPWQGVLERRRFECVGAAVQEQTIDATDRFDDILADRMTARRILTVLPDDPADVASHMTSDHGETQLTSDGIPIPTAVPPITGRTLVDFDTTIAKEYFGVGTDAERDEIVSWVHGTPMGTGDPPDEREDAPLGDIYHSSPVIVGPPLLDLPDESFNLFRQRPEVATRPHVVYVGSNDGLLHAFAVDDAEVQRPGDPPPAPVTVTAGEELWAFVPPILLTKLELASTSHQLMVDATPVVHEVFYGRTPGSAAQDDLYHTVLIVGLRQGGTAYVALDVTDPLAPLFLWQFNDGADLGETYGTPGVTQALVDLSTVVHQRGVAILPGGAGVPLGGSCAVPAAAQVDDADPYGTGRLNRRCWGADTGRSLFFLDIATGRLLHEIDDTVFMSPLTGGVSVFSGEIGAVGTRAFFTDADGIIWRADMSNLDPANWTAKPMHDLYYDGAYDDAEPAYFPPVISTNLAGEVVVIQGTGNIDILDDSTASNRVASFTEKTTFNAMTGALTEVHAELTWEIALNAGELVTGPLELFNERIYFGTFTTASDPLDFCEFGHSRIFGVEFHDGDGMLNPLPGLESVPGSGNFDLTFYDQDDFVALGNQIVFGVAVAQRPNCVDGAGVMETDPFIGARQHYRVDQVAGAQFELLAQLSGGTGQVNGGSVGEISLQVATPDAITSVQSFVGSVE